MAPTTSKADQEEDSIIIALKAERKGVRTAFTTSLTKFNTALKEKDPELARHYVQLQDKHRRLCLKDIELQQKRRSTMDETQIAEEIKHCEEYHDKMSGATYDFEKWKRITEETATGLNQVPTPSQPQVKVYRLPKLQLESFELKAKTWIPFWAQYKRIYEDPELDFSDKFQYLLMSLKEGQAKDMVLSHPRDQANLDKAIEALQQRYGRETVLIEVYTRELISIVLSKETKTVSKLYDQLSTQLRALEGLGMTTEKCAFIFYPLVESCLSTDLLKVWERQRRGRDVEGNIRGSRLSLYDEDNYNPLDELMKFLEDEVISEERIKLAVQPIDDSLSSVISLAPRQTTAALTATDQGKSRSKCCIFCEKQDSHSSQDCIKAQKMTESERVAAVNKHRACFRCLKPNHMSFSCKASVKCILCNKSHYVLMCREKQGKEKQHRGTKEGKKGQNDEKEKSHANFAGNNTSTYLKTLLIKIVSSTGRYMIVRALLDDGAHKSYCTQEVIDKLQLKPERQEFISHGLFGGLTGPSKEYNVYEIDVESLNGNGKQNITVVGQEKICHELARPSPLRDPSLFAALTEKGVCLSDIGENPPPVQLLLGADTLGKILTGSMHVLKNGITAVHTKLGWSVLGTSSRKARSVVSTCLNAICIPENMWDLEAIGITEPVMPPSDCKKEVNDALVHFENTICRQDDGRYVVALPWKAGHPRLNDNLSLACARLESTTEKLKRDKHFDAYDQLFKEWLSSGIIEHVPEDKNGELCHYLPHRPVIKMEKVSTKIRPVFDALAKRPGSASLNECLFKGINLLQEIPPLLVKFRLGTYGLTADIKQAFLQLLLKDRDRDVLRFLWWRDDGEIQVYRHCRVVFGVSCSPFLLNATIAYHLSKEYIKEIDDSTKQIISKLKESFYVDDSVASFNTKEELDAFINKSTEIMLRGKFELRRWTSNATWLQSDNQDAMVLGLKWNLEKDTLSCVGVEEKMTNIPITKRSLLGLINAVYDPLGMISPALLPARMMLQDTWKMKLDWDEPLPQQMQKNYNAWARSLSDIENYEIPRHICSENFTRGIVSLHVFSDASQKGYGCCLYLRHEVRGMVTVSLVTAKSRVAPLKTTTIPRMELLGACVAVRLRKSLDKVLESEMRTYFWTDSMTVLAWVTKGLLWGTFVGNRIKEIRNGSNINDWRYVPGVMNPADVASRGCPLQQLLEMKWWEGPIWLYQDERFWPTAVIECPQETLLESKDKNVALGLTILKDSPMDNVSSELFYYFSSYLKLLRMVAWIMRFRNKRAGTLTADEVNAAERKVVAIIQQEGDCHVQGAETHRDDEGLLRVTSRIVDQGRETSLMILPSKHGLVTRLIRQVHKELQHAGVGTTLNKLREKFWLIKGRNTVKKVLANCVICRKLQAKKCQPEPSVLPIERTTMQASPFQCSGMDLFGPLYLRDGVKVWGILFTCAVYRCVRLDLVESLSTESFVRALRRFLARNNCAHLISDHGSNFKGLSNQLQDVDWNIVADFASTQRLKMTHIPPVSPWMGGFWERLVGVVKQSLRKQVGAASLTRDELLTIFLECENVVNSRPLTYVSNDAQDLQAITPAHFLQETPGVVPQELDVLDRQNLIKRVQYVQSVRDQLRERFVREYLSLLIQRNGHTGKTTVKVGDIVLVETENKKRQLWPLGRVLEIIPGQDGKCRVARVKIQSGELIRPFQRLFPLEANITETPIENDLIKIPVSENDNKPQMTNSPESLTKSHNNLELTPKLTTRAGRVIKKPKKFNFD